MTSTITGSTEATCPTRCCKRLPTTGWGRPAGVNSTPNWPVCSTARAPSPKSSRHQAGEAFRLGDVASAALAGRSAAAAARDALDRFALSGAASWIELLRDTGHEPVAGTADVLDAELRIARGEFDAAARLVRPLTIRSDDIGTRSLVLATEATAGTGDLRAAEEFGDAPGNASVTTRNWPRASARAGEARPLRRRVDVARPRDRARSRVGRRRVRRPARRPSRRCRLEHGTVVERTVRRRNRADAPSPRRSPPPPATSAASCSRSMHSSA